MTMSMLRSGKAPLILDLAITPVVPGAVCRGKSHGANMLPTTVSSIAGILVIIQLLSRICSFLRRITWPLSCKVWNSGNNLVEVLGSKYGLSSRSLEIFFSFHEYPC